MDNLKNVTPSPHESEAQASGMKLVMPSDETLGEMAAQAWVEYLSRGYGHIEPRDAFLRGYAMAVRHLLAVMQIAPREERQEKLC